MIPSPSSTPSITRLPPDVEAVMEVYECLTTDVAQWPASERQARMAALLATVPEEQGDQRMDLGALAMAWAQQSQSGPWFEDLGALYAARSLSEETQEALDVAFQTGREVAMAFDHVDAFTALCTPPCRWDAVAHAKTLAEASRRSEVVPAIWAQLWASNYATDRSALFRRIAAYDGPFVRDVFESLFGVYQADPQPVPAALAQGVMETLKQGETAEIFEGGWTAERLECLCRPHVPADTFAEVIRLRWLDLGGDLDSLLGELADRVLSRASRATQDTWLSQAQAFPDYPWSSLPRTRAQVRQHDLAQQPATFRSHRPRS